MKAIVTNKVGSPLEVLELKDIPIPMPQNGEALVRMKAASINPGDFLFVQKLYPPPKWPKFPNQVIGNHGVGIIESVAGKSLLPVGTLVAFSYYNAWAEYAVVPIEYLIPLANDYPLGKAAQIVNLVTAFDLLQKASLRAGDWLVLTAGNSSVSTMVAQLANAKSIKVISVVRKINRLRNLLELGSREIIESSQVNVPAAINNITGGTGVRALIDHVGGPLTGELIRCLDFGGKVVINGVLNEQPYLLSNRDILMKGLSIDSYVYRYFFDPPTAADTTFLAELTELTAPESFKVTIDRFYPITEFREAVAHTYYEPENGKRLFSF